MTLDLSAIKADPEILAQLAQMNDELESLKAQKTERSAKGTNKDGLLAALKDALETENKAGNPKVTGKNEAFVRLFNDGFEYEDGTTVDPKELLDSFAELLETNPGVTVDRKKLEMSPVFGQWSLRVYNRPEVSVLAKAAEEA